MQAIVNNWLSDWSRGDTVAVVEVLLSGVAIVLALLGWTLRAWLTERRLITESGSDLYLQEDIANATRYYVRPDATANDLAEEIEGGINVAAPREDLFKAVERFIDEESKHRHLLLLADAGMGKSSFVLNYYDYNRRKWFKRYKMVVIPLGHEKALEKIRGVKRPNKTILFLDAFDEDPKARKDYEERLNELMKACSEFRRVLITCRTQFFPKDTEIPKAATLILTPRSGEAQHIFRRLYLAPFSDKQVNTLLDRRFRFWSVKEKRKARELAKKVPKLTGRPMLLTYMPDLLQSEKQVTTTWDIYEIITEKWYVREQGFWKRKDDLKKFSEEIAVHFYLNFLEKGTDRVAKTDVANIVEDLRVAIEDIDEWKATARSLLHRDAYGAWKFAHRSIMEFLFLKRFFGGDKRCCGVVWTEQMKKFIIERNGSNKSPKLLSLGRLVGADLSKANLSELNLSRGDFGGVNLKEAILESTNLRDANLTGADLTGANLTDADLTGADLTGADLTGADLTGVDLSGAVLRGATLMEATLWGAVLSGAVLRKADLRDTELNGAVFRQADLTGADLRGADLKEISLSSDVVLLHEADFTGADLTGVVFE